MSLLHPSRITRSLLKLASLGLAGLLAGLLTGCSSTSTPQISSNEIQSQAAPTYTSASATASAARNIVPSPHAHPCFAAPCQAHVQTVHARPLRHL